MNNRWEAILQAADRRVRVGWPLRLVVPGVDQEIVARCLLWLGE
jgi:hypothetical protein